MSELCLDRVLFDAEIPKALLLAPSTREEWANVLGCDRSTLRRWESYLLDKKFLAAFIVYRWGGNIKVRVTEKGEERLSVRHHLSPHQKFFLVLIKHYLANGFRSVPDILKWLGDKGTDGRSRIWLISPWNPEVENFLAGELGEEKHSDFDFSPAIATFGLDEFRESSTREQWAGKLGVSYKTLTRWEKQVIGVPVSYDFLGAQLQGKPMSQCREEAKIRDAIAGEYCHGDAGWKRLDGFQKLYLLVIRELKTAHPNWTSRDIRNYLETKIEGVPRSERLTRDKFSNWLTQQP